MKKYLPLFFAASAFTACSAPQTEHANVAPKSFSETVTDSTAAYDSILAKKLGADEYGMKAYVMAYLKEGPNRDQDSAEEARIQQAHLANIGRLARTGKLMVAGPFLDTGAVRGIFIFNTASVDEARKLTESDPAVKAGRLIMELHPWYGSAAMQLVTPLHKRCEKKNIMGN